MNREITYHIPEENEGQKIQHFLRRKGYSRQSLIELKKREGSAAVNQTPKHFNERLHAGDILCIRISEDESSSVAPVCLPVGIVYEDEDLLVVSKPAGMPTHPSFKNTDNTLANALAWYYQEKKQSFIFRCSNRLDRDTSGLTIVSKHYVSAAILSEMGTRREISREYLAIVRGHVEADEGVIDAPLGRKDTSIIERCVDFENGERAVTHYRVIGRFTVPCPACGADESAGADDTDTSAAKETPTLALSLVSLRLETGRTHQIRVHMLSIGHPLIGDYLYDPAYSADQPQPISRQALHAWHLRFSHPITGTSMSFFAPLPEDMGRLLPEEIRKLLPENM